MQTNPGMVHASYAALVAMRCGTDIRQRLDCLWEPFLTVRHRKPPGMMSWRSDPPQHCPAAALASNETANRSATPSRPSLSLFALQLEMPIASICAGMEMAGMAYDHRVMLGQLQPLKEELAGALAACIAYSLFFENTGACLHETARASRAGFDDVAFPV